MKEEEKKKNWRPKIRGDEEPKKKEERTDWTQEKKEKWRRKEKKRSKGAVDLTSGSLHVCLITKMSLKTELSKLKIAKMRFQFS